jgi:hypothetical protein
VPITMFSISLSYSTFVLWWVVRFSWSVTGKSGLQHLSANQFYPYRSHPSIFDRDQACKFVCLMSDMSLSPCLSCLSLLGLEKAIGWIGRLSVDRISSESDDR